ncbi:MAG: endolytic transglycosylase MltG [Rickettsiaceae bacterium]|nr:MAG: endolytic transglycosylase MltG [Rickettsiaceae bacterium]
MFKYLIKIKLALITVALLLGISFINLIIVYLSVPGPLEKVTTLIVTPRSSTKEISIEFGQNNIISHKYLFYLIAKIYSLRYPLKSGEYIFTNAISPLQVLAILANGKSVIHKLIITEGMTTNEIIAKINSEPRLTGIIEDNISEGFLMPSTYLFSYGDTKEQIINQMRKAMTLAIDQAMIKLSPDSPLKSRSDVLTLASIVEKEAKLDEERAIIAAVFLNRLKKGMKLQADPTSIYAITQGKAKLSRALTRKDLLVASPYNTYYSFGLPPGAISCPGTKSIMAVVSPAVTKALYFVVDGMGGHNFSEDIVQHNMYFQQYKKYRTAKQMEGNQD